MSKYQFSDKQRYAMFTVHGSKCYMCQNILDLQTMEIDHVIPERLDGKDELCAVIETFGLSPDFDVNSYVNWRPICRSCNGKKQGRIFKPSLLFQRELEFAFEKSGKCQAAEEKITNERSVSRSINCVNRAFEDGVLSATDLVGAISEELLEAIKSLHKFQQDVNPLPVNEPLLLAPNIGVFYENDALRIIKGPYGVGFENKSLVENRFMRCGACGALAFNGARCVTCGNMDDD